MSESHVERLVSTETDDGFVLEGAQFTPAQQHPRSTVVVWMHGFTGRFYEQHTVSIGRRLADRGHTFVTGNNRGHDLGANVHRVGNAESLQAGAWWEDVADCRYDLSAWIAFGGQLGGGARLVLAGHSLGAYKAVTYMGTTRDPRVAGLISASGPLRIWERHARDPGRLKTAEAMVKAGRGHELLPADGSGRVTSAQTLVWRARFGMDPYGFQNQSESAPLAHVECPVLFVLGSEEPEIGRESDLPRMQQNARSAASVDSVYVQGANHVYQGHELDVADAIGDWLERQ